MAITYMNNLDIKIIKKRITSKVTPKDIKKHQYFNEPIQKLYRILVLLLFMLSLNGQYVYYESLRRRNVVYEDGNWIFE